MKNVIFVFLVIVSSAGSALASTWHTSTIKAVYPQANGSVVFAFITDSPSCTNTNTSKYYYLTVGYNGVTAEGFKNIYSAMLSAAAQGKEMQFSFDEGSSGVI